MIELGTKSNAELSAELAHLRELHERYRRFAENAQDVLFVISVPNRSYSYINPACHQAYGYSPEEFYAHHKLEEELLHPDWRQRYTESLDALLAGNTPASFDYQIVHKSGEPRWMLQRSTLVTDDEGRPIAIEGIVTDVTDRKATCSQAQQYLDIAGVMMVGLDTTGCVSMINRKGCEVLEYESDVDLLGKNWFDMCIPEQLVPTMKRVFDQVIAGVQEPSEVFEHAIRTKSGTERIISWRNSMLKDVDGLCAGTLSSGNDVTERRRAEEELKQSRERLQMHIQQTPLAMIEWNLTFEVVDWNPAATQTFGFTKDEAIGRHAAGLLVPTAVRPLVDRIWQDLLTREGGSRSTNENMTKDGRTIVCEWHNTPLVDNAGTVIGVVSLVQDVSEREQAEQTRVRLQTAIEQTAESIIITDADATIEYANPAVERLTGYTLEEVIGKTPRLFASGRQSKEHFQKMWSTLQQGEVWQDHLISKRKDQSLFNQETTISPIRDAAGKITNYVSVGRDVTHEVELEARLRQAQKMEAMGTLAGGVAHDFNNLLQAMLGYADLVKSDVPKGSPTAEFVDQIIHAGDRAVELVSQILAFSRQTDREQTPLQLQSFVREALKLLRPSLPSTIEITQRIDTESRPIVGDGTELHQAVMNLCTNAYHAMRQHGGILDVRVEEVELGTDLPSSILDLAPGTYVRLTVADTGIGMAETVLARAFDPYFTTKPVGEGTGMGLATVLGIAEKNGGTVTAESKLGHGSVFQMYWPIDSHTKVLEQPTVEETTESSGTENLLLVDDEELVLGQAKVGLERLGYRVDAHTSSVEALRTFEAAPHRYDAVITDQTMPNMTGLELARRILTYHPNTPIILCSGFSELADNARAKGEGISGFVRKPMLTAALAEEVRRAFKKQKRNDPCHESW